MASAEAKPIKCVGRRKVSRERTGPWKNAGPLGISRFAIDGKAPYSHWTLTKPSSPRNQRRAMGTAAFMGGVAILLIVTILPQVNDAAKPQAVADSVHADRTVVVAPLQDANNPPANGSSSK
jgi:hypothetical protein